MPLVSYLSQAFGRTSPGKYLIYKPKGNSSSDPPMLSLIYYSSQDCMGPCPIYQLILS